MSEYRPWKELERRHAKRMPDGVRLWRPDYGDSMPDGESPTDTWDCKALSRQAIVRLFLECERKYREYTKGRRFHLCLFDPTRPRAGDLVVLKAQDYIHLLACEELAQGVVQAFQEHVDSTNGGTEATTE